MEGGTERGSVDVQGPQAHECKLHNIGTGRWRGSIWGLVSSEGRFPWMYPQEVAVSQSAFHPLLRLDKLGAMYGKVAGPFQEIYTHDSQ